MGKKRYTPDELLALYREFRASCSTEEFMRKPVHKKTQELWCAAHFSRAYNLGVKECFVHIDPSVNASDSDTDFDLEIDGCIFPFQVTEVQEPGRRRGDEYKNGKEPAHMRHDWSVGSQDGPHWVREGIELKVKKRYSGAEHLNLLLYLNFEAWSQEYSLMEEACREPASHFASVWLLNGNAMCCVYSRHQPPTPHWLVIPESLVYPAEA